MDIEGKTMQELIEAHTESLAYDLLRASSTIQSHIAAGNLELVKEHVNTAQHVLTAIKINIRTIQKEKEYEQMETVHGRQGKEKQADSFGSSPEKGSEEIKEGSTERN